MDQFSDADLGRAVGLHQTRVGDERKVFPRFRVLNLIEQDGRQQHRVDPMHLGFSKDHRLQGRQPLQGQRAQWLELVNATGEQLG